MVKKALAGEKVKFQGRPSGSNGFKLEQAAGAWGCPHSPRRPGAADDGAWPRRRPTGIALLLAAEAGVGIAKRLAPGKETMVRFSVLS